MLTLTILILLMLIQILDLPYLVQISLFQIVILQITMRLHMEELYLEVMRQTVSLPAILQITGVVQYIKAVQIVAFSGKMLQTKVEQYMMFMLPNQHLLII